MAFATIPSWSTTAGTNTEIDGISLAENVMVPSAVNNAFREMMSQVAEFTRRGSDLASAATLDLDSIDTMFLDITGTTTVTAVTLTDGHSRRARATGAFQITASATLVVNGSTSSNYTTTAGDLLFFEGYSAGVVRVTVVGTPPANGTYTPTLTNTANVASSTASLTQYYRIGNMVTVFGNVVIDPTTAAVNTEIQMSLPIASALSSSIQVGGAGASVLGDAWRIVGTASTDTASFQTVVKADTAQTIGFQFSYQVL